MVMKWEILTDYNMHTNINMLSACLIDFVVVNIRKLRTPGADGKFTAASI